MPNQFTVYASSDAGGPGYLYGTTGSLTAIFDACLYTGYTNHPAAGWLKPFANTGSISASVSSSNSLACYQQPSGSKCTLYLNDFTPYNNGGTVAWACGWETLTAMGAPVGTGSGQFPLPSQLQTTGHVSVRKSATADATTIRPWILFADDRTIYFCAYSDGYYCAFFFGDIFSLAGDNPNDPSKCIIAAHTVDNNATTETLSRLGIYIGEGGQLGSYISRPNTRGQSNAVGSTAFGKYGDISKAGQASAYYIYGSIPAPNPQDNSLYIAPIWIADAASNMLRGRMRGFYHLCHPNTSFVDGQVIAGSNEFVGKTFRIVKPIGSGGAMFCIETSPTLDTNQN